MQVKRKDKCTMKTKLQIFITVLSIVFSMAKASAQQPVPINPQTGLPEPVTQIDPATGLPADGSPPFKNTNGAATWIDPSWKDPDVVLPRIDFQNIPLTEVTRILQERFVSALKVDYFDIILPSAAPGFDPTQIDVQLELKNVKASEIFSAMNLQFALNGSPLRWELTLNGSRPTAILRILPQLAHPAPPQIEKVFFVGDMLDQYPGTNDVEKLRKISDLVVRALGDAGIQVGKINNYPAGQLLIVSGTPDQVDLAEQTLRALKEKAEFEKTHTLAQPANP